jgi:hypothetical protein
MTVHHLDTFRRLVFLIILTCRSDPLCAKNAPSLHPRLISRVLVANQTAASS